MVNREYGFLLVICLATALLLGCADQRVNRDDDEAMMIYRECMSGPPPAMNSADMSMTGTTSGGVDPSTSIAAKSQTRQEESQEIRCMQLAGWED